MSLTQNQDIPSRSEAKGMAWTSQKLLSLKSTVAAIAKTFNALEVILFFELLVTGVGELAGRKLSVGWYVTQMITLAVNAGIRILNEASNKHDA